MTLSKDYLYANKINVKDYIIKPIIATASDRGFYSNYSFWKRFEIFTDGIFNGLDINKIYFGGSVISACSIRNPLEALFDIKLPKDQDLIFEKRLDDLDPGYTSYIYRINKLYKFWKIKETIL